MIGETIISIIFLIGGLGLFLFFLILEDRDATLDKIMDESCYYCMFSRTPHSIRDKSKNTCQIIDNTGWSSEEIKHCKYRCKK